jgi:pimeloyl-ACP methyl ester carboxylesterase
VVSAPMQPLRSVERLKIMALVRVFAMVGWRPWLLEAVKDGLLLPENRARHPELDAYVADAAMTPGRERTLRAMKGVMLGRPSLVDRLSAIEAPTLFVTSAHDSLWLPEIARQQARHVRRSELAVLTKTRHVPSLEEPQAFARLLSEWLDTSSSSQT